MRGDRLLLVFACLSVLLGGAFASAQEVSGQFKEGSVLVGYDTATCNAARDGAMRFNSATDTWNYCDGAAWTAFGSGVSFPLLASPQGTAAAPAYSFTDSDTGMFSDTANTLEFTAGGVEALELGTTASAVNYLRVTPNATTLAPIITNVGTDTNGAGLGINITGKTATAAGVGGGLALSAGNSNGNNAGGTITLTGGSGGGTTGVGGAVTVQAGRAVSGGTNIAGGTLNVAGGTATGLGQSKISFQVAGTTAAGALNGTGTADGAPVERMALLGDGDFLLNGGASGYTGTASVPVTGAGTRMFFDVQKAAFRAGRVFNTNWDNASIGNYSVALGSGNIASANVSTAFGDATTASAFYSTAMGQSTVASGTASTAMGQSSIAGGTTSTAMGSNTTANGDFSLAAGNEVNVTATGDSSFGFGLTPAGITTDPQVSGAQSFGIFMGNQNAVDFAAANTMGVFGGKMVIDSTVPATNLVADTELEIDGTLKIGDGGEACAAGIAGGIRYNTGVIQWCNGTAWANIGGAVSFPLLANPIGTALAPAYSFNADSNTGMFSDTADTVEFTAGGVQALELGTTASAVNYLRITPNATTLAPTITNVGTDTNGAGLGINITGKNASAAGVGGGIALTAGNANNGGTGGGVTINAGNITAGTGAGGALTFTAGGGSGGNGGAVSISGGGVPSGTGAGGALTLTAGAGGGGAGGAVAINGGTVASGSGAGGVVSISGGDSIGGANVGGAVTITGGSGGGTGAGGAVTVRGGPALSGQTNIAGGQLIVAGGSATGNATSKLSFQVAGTTAAGVLNGTGTTLYAPVERMALLGDGDFLLNGGASGYTGTASVPVTGAGSRMLFDVQKGAFRAGRVTGTQWDNGSIGNWSVALGQDVTASGDGAVALGSSSTASGGPSFAAVTATASGQYSTAIGNGATASGLGSFAVGSGNVASGINSFAFGREASAGNGTAGNGMGDHSVAFSLSTTLSATDPMVTGQQSFGIFMGAQSAVNFAAANTMGVFGGKMVIDSTVPATNLVADTELEIDGTLKIGDGGEACAAGIAGAIRYNGGAVQYCNGTAWGGMGSVSFPLLANPTGTAAAPAYSFNADSNTGMFSDTADTVEFTAGGVQALELGTVTSGVNYLRIIGGPANTAPIITNVGTDTNNSGLGIQLDARDASASGNGGNIIGLAGNGNTTGAGGNIAFVGGTGAGTGAGGQANYTAGQGGATGSGGDVNLFGGAGGATSGAGGNVNIEGGNTTDGNSGNIFIAGANATGTNRSAGAVLVGVTPFETGYGTGTGSNSYVAIKGGGVANAATAVSGEVYLLGGRATPAFATSAGAKVIIKGGPGGTTSGNAAGVDILGGTPVAGTGANITITASNGVGTNMAGGDILMTLGAATGTGTPGLASISGVTSLTLPAGTSAQQPGAANMPAAVNGMVRYNTTNNKFEARENAAWKNMIGSPAQPTVTVISGTTHSPGVSDNGAIFIYTNAAGCTVTLPSIATVGAGYSFEYINDSGADVILNRSGTDTIDPSATTFRTPENDGINRQKLVVANGKWYTLMPRWFQSADTAIPTTENSNAFAHNLGAAPIYVEYFLKNTTAELDYEVGDIVPYVMPMIANAAGSNMRSAMSLDATNVTVIQDGTIVPSIMRENVSATYANITKTNWNYFVRAYY
jgi:hypothetical protein